MRDIGLGEIELDITSTANPRVKALARLRRRRYRDESGQTLVEGFEELRLALSAGVVPRAVYCCPDLVDAREPAEKLLRAARGADKALIASVGLFDLYEGERIEAGKKSVAISVVLQPTERTLTDAEIEAVSQKIVAAVAKATGATLRS